jgi:hypothetical protein
LAHGLLNHGYCVEILELEGVTPNEPSFYSELAMMGVRRRVASDLALMTLSNALLH